MICLTFDTDHCSEKRMREMLNGSPLVGDGTFFCTEAFNFIANEFGHEVAPHPYLPDNANWEAVLQEWRTAFPQAQSWRSHSLTFSQFLAVRCGQLGYKIVSVSDHFGQVNLQPTYIPWGVWNFPIYYMDNIDFNRPNFNTVSDFKVFDKKFIDQALEGDGVYVFDFHPIHILLNTPNYPFYQQNQKAFIDGEDTKKIRYNGYGVANFYYDLNEAMLKRNIKSLSLSDAFNQWKTKNKKNIMFDLKE